MRVIVCCAIFTLFGTLKFEVRASSIITFNDGEQVLAARNVDWHEQDAEICFFKEGPGHAHFTLHVGYGKSMPNEGINEHGLFIGVTAQPSKRASAPFSFKKMVTSLGIVKKVLEKAKNANEAIQVFDEYHILFGNFLGFPTLSYLIIDRSGNKAVLEFVDDSIVIYKKDRPKYQVLTNFLFTEFPHAQALKQPLWFRYRQAVSYLEAKANYSVEDMRNVVRLISQEASVEPGLKLIFAEDRKYAYGEIKEIFLAGGAMPIEMMDPFEKETAYSRSEIGQKITRWLDGAPPAHTITSTIYGLDDMDAEIYYMRNWDAPIQFNVKSKLETMATGAECAPLPNAEDIVPLKQE